MSRSDGERTRLALMIERMRACMKGLESALRGGGPIGADAGHAVVGTATEIATTIAKHDAYALAETGGAEPERRAPVQGEVLPGLSTRRGRRIQPGTIAWWEHEQAWADYARRFGAEQSADRIAERGGFSFFELVEFLGHPPTTWRPA